MQKVLWICWRKTPNFTWLYPINTTKWLIYMTIWRIKKKQENWQLKILSTFSLCKSQPNTWSLPINSSQNITWRTKTLILSLREMFKEYMHWAELVFGKESIDYITALHDEAKWISFTVDKQIFIPIFLLRF